MTDNNIMNETEIRLLDKTCINEDILESLEDHENWEAVYLLSKYVCMSENLSMTATSESYKMGNRSFQTPTGYSVEFDKQTSQALAYEYACKQYPVSKHKTPFGIFSLYTEIYRCTVLIVNKLENNSCLITFLDTTLLNAATGSLDVDYIFQVRTNQEKIDELDELEETIEESKSLPVSWQKKVLGL